MTFDEIKDEIRQRCDIVDVINSYVPLKKAGVNHVACCPFHNEKTPSFNVSGERQFFHCFGCQKGGDIFTFVMEFEGVDFIGAMRTLTRYAGIPFDEEQLRSGGSNLKPGEARARQDKRELLLELHEKLALWFRDKLHSAEGRQALDYIKGRGMRDDLMEQFCLGYAPESWDACLEWGRRQGYPYEAMIDAGVVKLRNEEAPDAGAYDTFRNRLMFPIGNPQGHIVGFSGRALTEDGGPKYLNTPSTIIFDKSSILYGLPLARKSIRELGYAIICEGQLDVIACHGAGFTNAVAPQGTAFTQQQAQLLKRHAEKLVLCFDADNAGTKAALRSMEIVVPEGLSARVVVLGEGEDPDSLVRTQGPQALQERIDSARDFYDFLLDCLHKKHDVRTAEGKGAIASEYLNAVASLQNLVTRAAYCKRLADRLSIPEEFAFKQLEALMNRRKRTQRYQEQRQEQHNGKQPPPFDADEADETLALPDEESLISKAEAVLLDIAIHHESYARRMVEEVSHDYISDTPVGRALNIFLAHTAQGEWKEGEQWLRESLSEAPVPALCRMLLAPQYGPDVHDRSLSKAYRDCHMRLVQHYYDAQLHQLQADLSASQEKEQKHEILRSIMELKNRQREIMHTP